MQLVLHNNMGWQQTSYPLVECNYMLIVIASQNQKMK
jgi:hypothetical protein